MEATYNNASDPSHRKFFLCTTAAAGLIFFSALPSFCADTTRPLKSLTVDERMHLPDDTLVTLPWRRTVTLGTLREEHRARMEAFRRATAWGKTVGGTITKPAPAAGGSSKAVGVTAQQPAGGGSLQLGGAGLGGGIQSNQIGANAALGQPNAGGSKTKATLAGQQQKQGGANGGAGLGGGIQNNQSVGTGVGRPGAGATLAGQQKKQGGGSSGKGGSLQLNSNGIGGQGGSLQLNGNGSVVQGGGLQLNGGQNNGTLSQPASATAAPSVKNAGKVAVSASTAVSGNLFLVPRQQYPGVPIPFDYLAFCNAAQASSCIYLPPSANFVNAKYLPSLSEVFPNFWGKPDGFIPDVDPLLTDPALCQGLGGVWMNDVQACTFMYFVVQQTTFKPTGTPASAASCNPETDYHVDPKLGTIKAEFPLPAYFDVFQTDAAPVTCVVQEWLYP